MDILAEINRQNLTRSVYQYFLKQDLSNLKIDKNGNIKILCVFHDEKTPSLSINIKTGLFKCFGCDATGNLITFVSKHKGYDNAKAVEIIKKVAGFAGNKLGVKTCINAKTKTKNGAKVTVNKSDAAFFIKQLQNRQATFFKQVVPINDINENAFFQENIILKFQQNLMTNSSYMKKIEEARGWKLSICNQLRLGLDGDGDKLHLARIVLPIYKQANKFFALKFYLPFPQYRNKKDNPHSYFRFSKNDSTLKQWWFNAKDINCDHLREQVFIFEGESDAITIKSLFPDIKAISGITGGHNLTPQMAMALKGKNIVIVPDIDTPGISAAQLLIKQLLYYGVSSLRLVIIPQIKGGISTKITDITEYSMLPYINKNIIRKLLFNSQRYYSGILLFNMNGELPWFEEKKDIVKLVTGKLVTHIEQNSGVKLFFHRDYFFLYKNNVYSPATDREVEKIICQFLPDNVIKMHHLTEILKLLEVKANEEELMTNDAFINVQNGMVEWNKKALPAPLFSHSPNFKSIYQINTTYDPSAECPQFKKFLGEVLEEDAVNLMQELIGALLIPKLAKLFHKLFFFVGGGGNGKSTLIKLISNFMGEKYVSFVKTRDLIENRFATADLFMKFLNVHNELSDRRLDVLDLLKDISGGDPIRAEKKFKDSFNFEPTVMLIISCNKMPQIKDTSFGVKRRIVIFNFSQTIGKEQEIKGLDIILRKEKPGILNWALIGLRRIIKQQQFSEPKSVLQSNQEFWAETDILSAFMDGCFLFTGNSEDTITIIKLHEFYIRYCESVDYQAKKKLNFARDLWASYSNKVKKGRSAKGIFVKGIKVREDKKIQQLIGYSSSPFSYGDKKDREVNMFGLDDD